MTLYNLEAEKYILGCILLGEGKDEVSDNIFTSLAVRDFHELKHQTLFMIMQGLYNNGLPLDLAGLSGELQKKGNEAVEMQYVIELSMVTYSNANHKHHLATIKDLSSRRLLQSFGSYISKQTDDENKTTSQLMSEAEELLSKLTMRNVKTDLVHVSIPLEKEIDRIKKTVNGEKDTFGLRTGFSKLDYALWGLQDGNMVVIAARPAVGKTAFALNVMHNSAVKYKKTCAFFSLDMPSSEITQRLIGINSGIDSNTLKSGKSSYGAKLDIAKLDDVTAKMKDCKIYIDDTGDVTVSDILAKSKKLKRTVGLDLIIVDYLQKVKPARDLGNPVIEIGETARGIKNMARQLNVPVIAIAQPNRELDKKSDGKQKNPTMSDLRGSGEIEQEADIIAFMQSDNPPEDVNKKISFQIVKFRNGQAKNIAFDYKGSIFTFTESDAAKGDGLVKLSEAEQQSLPF